MMISYVTGKLLLLFVTVTHGKIWIDTRFDDLYPFKKDLSGPSSYIYTAPTIRNVSDGANMLITNTTYLNDPSILTYRAEMAIDGNLRDEYRHSNQGVSWWGFSVYIPPEWTFKGSRDPKEIMFYAQQHGGDNLGRFPTWGIRYNSGDPRGSFLQFAVAGAFYNESDRLAEEQVIKYFYLGRDQIGEWMDFVIRIDQQYTETGSVKVWRNNQLMIDESGLLTSYNDTHKQYLKFGCYHLRWKYHQETRNTWIAQYYSRFVFCEEFDGDVCTYDQLYTGYGDICGSNCKPLPEEPSYVAPFYKNIFFICFAPLGMIMCTVSVFMCTKIHMDQRYADEMRQHQRKDTIVWGPKEHTRLTAAEKIRIVRQNSARTGSVGGMRDSVISAVYAFRDTIIWAEEEEFVQASQLWENPWQASFSRRLFWYCFGYSFVFGMFVFALSLYGNPLTPDKDGLLPWKKIHEWQAEDAATFMIVSFVMTTIYFMPLLFIPLEIDKGKQWKNDPKFLARIGVVIPCHKSADEIGAVVKQIIKYIPPGNVVICDNGNFDWPKDNTFEVVKAVHPDIVYTFTSQGHKTRALWTGCHRLPRHCEYIMHIDDDTMISDNFVFDESHFTTKGAENVVAVAFLRQAHRMNRCTNFIDFWYKITDHFHATQAHITTRCFVPGPAGIWQRDKFEAIFAHHPALPFGEDIFGGFTILNHGYAIRAEKRCIVTTFAPTVLVNCGLSVGRVQGYGAASIWKQRAHRWTVSALRISGKSLYSFFTYNATGGILPNIAFRLYRFREYKIIFIQVLYIPFCLVILSRGLYKEFLVLKFGLFIFPLLRNLFINYLAWRGQPELQVSLETVLLSPFYNFFLIMCAVHGRLKCLLWYLPEVPPNHGMLQETKPRDIQTIRVMMPPTFERELETAMSAERKRKEMVPRDSTMSLDYGVYYGTGGDSPADDFHNPVFEANTITPADSFVTPVEKSIRGQDSIRFSPRAAAARRSSGLKNFNRTDYFEYFFRDGASVFISYKAGGIRLENPLPGAMSKPLGLQGINPVLGTEPNPAIVARNERVSRRRSSQEALQGILRKQSSFDAQSSPQGQKQSTLRSHVSFGKSWSFGSDGSGVAGSHLRSPKFLKQYESFQEVYDEDDEFDDGDGDVEMGGVPSNDVRVKASDIPPHPDEDAIEDFELMVKNRLHTGQSVYDVDQVRDDMPVAIPEGDEYFCVEDSNEPDDDSTAGGNMKWVDLVRMSEMIYEESEAYYHRQAALQKAKESWVNDAEISDSTAPPAVVSENSV